MAELSERLQLVKKMGIQNYLESIEADLIREALEFTSFNCTWTAKILGTRRTNLIYKRKKFGFQVGRPNRRYVRNHIDITGSL